MPKGEYTRKQAALKAYFEVTGEQLPESLTHDEIRHCSFRLPAGQSKRCHELYLRLMSLGRPDYLANRTMYRNGYSDHSE